MRTIQVRFQEGDVVRSIIEVTVEDADFTKTFQEFEGAILHLLTEEEKEELNPLDRCNWE